MMSKYRAFLFAIAIAIALTGSTVSAMASEAMHKSGATPVSARVRGTEHSTRVILLGTGGGPVPRKLRSQPASLLIVDGYPYLIDAGAGVVRQLARAGVEPYKIKRIFMTHYHLDHDAGLEPLMSFIWYGRNAQRMGKAPPVQIYGPPATQFLVRSALRFLSVSERIFISGGTVHLPAKPMFAAHSFNHNGIVYRDKRVCVTAVENTHYHFPKNSAAYKAGDKSYAYRFDTLGGSVVFTGDTGPSAAVTKLADRADLLVSEVIDVDAVAKVLKSEPYGRSAAVKRLMYHMTHEHLSPEAVGEMAAHAHVKAVLLHHLVPARDNGHDATIYTRGVHDHYAGPVIAGRDLFEYDLFARGDAKPALCK